MSIAEKLRRTVLVVLFFLLLWYSHEHADDLIVRLLAMIGSFSICGGLYWLTGHRTYW